jgi:hypothetical protein
VIEYAAKRRNLDGQIGILDNSPAPDGRHDLLFEYESAGSLDQHDENIEGSRTDRYGNKNAALIAPRKPLTLPIEAKFLEQENVPGGEHAPVSRVPAPFGPGEGSRMGSGADLVAIQPDLQLFCKIFMPGF